MTQDCEAKPTRSNWPLVRNLATVLFVVALPVPLAQIIAAVYEPLWIPAFFLVISYSIMLAAVAFRAPQ
jgi:hypothetical protein